MHIESTYTFSTGHVHIIWNRISVDRHVSCYALLIDTEHTAGCISILPVV